jgi:hypothetical protein
VSGETYHRTELHGVYWENRKGVNVIKSGLTAVDQASIYIPFYVDNGYLKPKSWQVLATKTGKWTLQTGDYIVKGIVAETISSTFTISNLKAAYDDVLQITSVDTQDYGSPDLQQWQIGAK